MHVREIGNSTPCLRNAAEALAARCFAGEEKHPFSGTPDSSGRTLEIQSNTNLPCFKQEPEEDQW